jgi:hypothetical protein
MPGKSVGRWTRTGQKSTEALRLNSSTGSTGLTVIELP